MKFWYLLLAAFCIANVCSCQTWKGTGVGNPGREIFYNTDNVTILNIGQHKNVIQAWFKEKFFNHEVSGVLYPSGYTLTLYAFDCKEMLWSINELIYSKPFGEVIRDYTYEVEWRETPPGTPMALLFYTIRNKYSGK